MEPRLNAVCTAFFRVWRGNVWSKCCNFCRSTGRREPLKIDIFRQSALRSHAIAMYAEFGRNLEKDIVSETSGHFRRLLVSVCNAGRDESTSIDTAKAEKDANDIYAVLVQPFCSLHFYWSLLCALCFRLTSLFCWFSRRFLLCARWSCILL